MSGSWSPAADAYITMTGGNAGAVGTGAYTMALLVRPASGNNNCGMLQARTNSAAVRSLLEDTLKLYGEGDFSSGYGSLTQDTWYVIAQTKPAGSAVYRMHYWAYAADGSGSFSHGVASGAGNHGDGSTVTQIRIGHAGNRGNGLIAVVGLWDVELSDGQIDTLKSANLSAWSALSPDELLSLENWDGVNAIDTKVGTSSFSSLTGTVSTGSNPPSFNFSISSATDLVIQDAAQAQTADNLALTQVHSLAVADASQAQTADNLALTQVHSLAVQDAAQAQTADNVTLEVLGLLQIADASQAQTADNLALTQVHNLVVADARQLQMADTVTLTVPVDDSRPGSFSQWLNILQTNAEEFTRELQQERDSPVECPNDGTPLKTGPDGAVYCPYDGWRKDN